MSNIKIIKKEKNPLLYREDMTIELKTDSNPSNEDIKEAVGGNKELIVVKRINANFGKHSFLSEAVVYESKEAMNKVEVIPQKVRKKLEEEAKKAAAPAA